MRYDTSVWLYFVFRQITYLKKKKYICKKKCDKNNKKQCDFTKEIYKMHNKIHKKTYKTEKRKIVL